MVYNTQNYWVSGLCPSSRIQNTRKHNVSETGFVSVLRRGGGEKKTPTLLGPLDRASQIQFPKCCVCLDLEFLKMGKAQKPSNPKGQ
jgi:hypothetical protein